MEYKTKITWYVFFWRTKWIGNIILCISVIKSKKTALINGEEKLFGHSFVILLQKRDYIFRVFWSWENRNVSSLVAFYHNYYFRIETPMVKRNILNTIELLASLDRLTNWHILCIALEQKRSRMNRKSFSQSSA